jgi:predicted nucleotidyltransferase component of viral defense system
MDLNRKRYFSEAKLMLEVMPLVGAEKNFALKGGTAINFFIRDMPRLSVDIDLTYLPIEDRNTSLAKMGEALERIAARISNLRPSIQVGLIFLGQTKTIIKLMVSEKNVHIKIEPNLVLRGTLFPTRQLNVTPKVEETFELATEMNCVSQADLYGGKICAALDRQHPRDLYDVKLLLENEGITDEIRKGFVVYLASHDRAISALLDPEKKDIQQLYKDQFQGMTLEPVSLHSLLEVREELILLLRNRLIEKEKEFLLSLKRGDPDWQLLGLPGMEQLPAIQWKLMNIRKMKPDQHQRSLEKLKRVLQL